MASDRSQPGETETAVAPCGASSLPSAHAMRPTEDFTRS
jgi:hypothetical protein